MGLIDLKTDLKALKYGKDRIGGGSSNQPFVQKPIPDSFSAVGNTGGLDVLTRGGTLAIGRTADDVSRLTKLLLTPSTFQGPFFTLKQNVLSRQGVQTQASPKGLNEGAYLPTSTLAQVAVSATGLHFNKQGKNPIPGLPGSLTTYSDVVEGNFFNPGIKTLENNRLLKFTDSFVNKKTLSNTLYSYPGGPGSILGVGLTTINTPDDQRTGVNSVNFGYRYPQKYVNLKNAQLLVQASTKAGLTFEEAGISYSDRFQKYSVTIPFGADNVQSLINLDFISNIYTGTKETGVNLNQNSNYALANDLTGSLYTPNTGVNSNSGQVPTDVTRTSRPTVEADKQLKNLDNVEAYTYTQQELITAPTYRETGQIQDFRTAFRNKGGDAKAVGADVLAPDYTEENIELRVHSGNPGTKGDVSDYTKGKVSLVTGQRLGALDTLNALPLYQSVNVAQDSEKDVNDLVKFRIAVLDPGGSSRKTFIHFRAFLDTITDNYNSEWTAHRYVGRGENFWTYQGFDRSISLGWTVYAQSKEELIPMYKKLNYLASSLAPNYNNGFMRGVLCQLTIGGYVYEQPGFIKGLTYELSDQSTWEIGINDKGFTDPQNRGDDLVKELPHMIRVTGFQFTPIHRFIPEIQKNTWENGNVATFGNQRYIALDNGYGNNYKN